MMRGVLEVERCWAGLRNRFRLCDEGRGVHVRMLRGAGTGAAEGKPRYQGLAELIR